MDLTIIYFLATVLIPVGIFFILGWLVMYHLKKYGLKNSFSNKAGVIFVLGILIISLVIIKQFFSIEWDNFHLEEVFETSNNNFFRNI